VLTSRIRSPTLGGEIALGFAPDALAGALVSWSESGVARTCRLPFYDPGRVLPRGVE
jgi:glycine cleavage system aminomethyltransferase T